MLDVSCILARVTTTDYSTHRMLICCYQKLASNSLGDLIDAILAFVQDNKEYKGADRILLFSNSRVYKRIPSLPGLIMVLLMIEIS